MAGHAPGSTAGAHALPALDVSGWQVSDQDGNNYIIPAALPPLPPGAFVLIHFDGLGPAADDYDLADGVAVLHAPAGLTDIFDDAADQVALYTSSQHSPATLQDFVAYGGPPADDANDAIAAGLWEAGAFVSLALGSGVQEAGAVLPTRSFGLYPGHTNMGPADWATYQGEDMSPGRSNPVPRAYWGTVSDGVTMSRDGFALGWAWTPSATYPGRSCGSGADIRP